MSTARRTPCVLVQSTVSWLHLMSKDFILETRDLVKEFKGFVAVNGVNLGVQRGQIHALIGPNGAGKTTVFNLLTKFLIPTGGQILFNGHDITTEKPAQVARRGDDITFMPFNQPALDLSEFAVSGRESAWFDVFAWSGRDLYRPGEVVRISALLRDNDGKPVPMKGNKAQPLFVRLKQPNGKPFVESRIEAGAQGYYRFEKLIPQEAPTGRWQVQFRTAPGAAEVVQGMSLRIEEFLPERMKLDLASAQKTLKPGEALQLDVTAAYLYGAPASGNRFTARLGLIAEQHPVEKYPDHYFGDPTIALPKKTDDIVDSELDEQGRLKTPIELPTEVKGGAPVSAARWSTPSAPGPSPSARRPRTSWASAPTSTSWPRPARGTTGSSGRVPGSTPPVRHSTADPGGGATVHPEFPKIPSWSIGFRTSGRSSWRTWNRRVAIFTGRHPNQTGYLAIRRLNVCSPSCLMISCAM